MVQYLSLFSQERRSVNDTMLLRQDTLLIDTLMNLKRISSDAIDKQVTYNAQGYIKNDLVNKKAFLVKNATVKYGDI
jgi:hypothetical protein